MPTEKSDQWLLITEAAKRLGISENAVRLRVSRGTLLASRDNRNHVRVSIPETSDIVAKMVVATMSPDTPTTNAVSVPLEAVQAMLAAERDRSDTTITQERTETARRLAERDSLHLDTLGRLQAQAALERSLWLERIDAAELRAERVEQRLDQVLDQLLQRQPEPSRTPWWRRWFGKVKRTDLDR